MYRINYLEKFVTFSLHFRLVVKCCNMKRIYIAILSLIMVSSVIAQDVKTVVNDPNAELRIVANFTGIKVSGGIGVYISQGKENAVAVSCSDEKHNNKIVTEVKNGVLNIYVEKGAWNGWNWKGVTVKAYITVQQLEKLDASGASAVKIVEGLKVDFLKIDLSGASVLKGRVEATSLKLDASGASSISLTGKSNTVSIDLSGASVLKAYEFEIENCKVEASGASSIGIHVSKQLDVEASGASSIRYIGEPTIKQISVTGSSSVKPKG